ncbi:hypothetical protein FC81_GL000115 [Liquorilactobacillus capillatus DSM 19910]|uniref:Prepilin type IV endopeptidase peptidase domain-containing protein n=1 Tax=Liquorilactobacillus capillatus DSM 19910 TaxID=1423731 RepID=A0A0R1M5M6_9LACO|nr:hypothetical protein FC81_GL000115 [Liquorilactobacillus capillatus DSM 19910]
MHLVFTFGLVLWALILSAQDFYSLTVSHNFLLVGGSLLSVGKFANIHFYLADWSFSLLFIIILFLFSHFNLLGSGDVIYLTFLFLLLGFYTTLYIILIGSTSAALYHFIYAQNKIPFIPFLSFGLLVLLL